MANREGDEGERERGGTRVKGDGGYGKGDEGWGKGDEGWGKKTLLGIVERGKDESIIKIQNKESIME